MLDLDLNEIPSEEGVQEASEGVQEPSEEGVQEPSEEGVQEPVSERYSRSTHEAESDFIWNHLSEEQKLDASNSFTAYCEPVEIYNTIQSRPRFLQRSLYRNRKEKHKKRILMTVVLSWKVDEIRSLFPMCIGLGRLDPNNEPTGEEKYHIRRIFTFEGPSGVNWDDVKHVRLNFMLPQVEKLAVETNYDKYFLFILASGENPISLSTHNASKLTSEVASNESSGGEKCLYGKVSLKFLYEILNISPDSPLKQRTEIQFSTELRSCNLKYWMQRYTRTESSTISIRDSNDSKGMSKKIEISTGFEEFGAAMEAPHGRTQEKIEESSLSSLLPHFTWLPGIVSFHYRYYHNMLRKVEVTENFTCAICLVQCKNFKSLKFHLKASHPIFNFEFSESKAFPSVSVSVKLNWRQELIDQRLETFMYCVKKPKRRTLKTSSHGRTDAEAIALDVELRIGTENTGCGRPIVVSDNGSNAMQQVEPEEVQNNEQVSNAESDPSQSCVLSVSDHDETRGVQEVDDEETRGVQEVDDEDLSKAIVVYTGPGCVLAISEHDNWALSVVEDEVSNAIILRTNEECVSPVSEHDNAARAVQEDEASNAIILDPSLNFVPYVPRDEGTSSAPQAKEKEKLLSERFDPNMLARWKKRKFYHSHTYQAMDLEEVVKDEDSEDEINEGARVVEEKRKQELLGVTEHEKRLMTMWGEFVKKHRVLVDGHMNWAFEAFTKHHCAELVESTPLSWVWRLFMIKLYDHGLLKPKTVGTCGAILHQYREQQNEIQKLKKVQPPETPSNQ
ncbi:polycomb group protein EMBRYONIC FLOWER 2-like isoform X2 [Vigna unguiculata]|uniref:polycomb group protein EMBRYONIC FLOWER 2-like isoform X2 n=1 Tax=Vigna unguiculata TaxID=3917 RepID=UPI001016C400|nr:polycomb group protein EMBRYONIC FLOWER 2-like isoform X2 [Vigna unguiculata]